MFFLVCIVDGDVYRNGDPVPTDDECERCTCRPPGFSCVLRDCDTKPGCKAVRRAGECCPEYVCGNFSFFLKNFLTRKCVIFHKIFPDSNFLNNIE